MQNKKMQNIAVVMNYYQLTILFIKLVFLKNMQCDWHKIMSKSSSWYDTARLFASNQKINMNRFFKMKIDR